MTQNLMTWKIYQIAIENLPGKSFKNRRLRLAILLLAITGARISEILSVRVRDLCFLEQKHCININNQTLLIQNSKAKIAIQVQSLDLQYMCSNKSINDYIFTKDINSKTHLSRETFTKIVNNYLRSIGHSMSCDEKLTSGSFRNWQQDS